jgi:hypothetical protein
MPLKMVWKIIILKLKGTQEIICFITFKKIYKCVFRIKMIFHYCLTQKLVGKYVFIFYRLLLV